MRSALHQSGPSPCFLLPCSSNWLGSSLFRVPMSKIRHNGLLWKAKCIKRNNWQKDVWRGSTCCRTYANGLQSFAAPLWHFCVKFSQSPGFLQKIGRSPLCFPENLYPTWVWLLFLLRCRALFRRLSLGIYSNLGCVKGKANILVSGHRCPILVPTPDGVDCSLAIFHDILLETFGGGFTPA